MIGDSHVLTDYETVRPSGGLGPPEGDASDPVAAPRPAGASAAGEASAADVGPGGASRKQKRARARQTGAAPAESWVARRGHLISYAGFLLFTVFVFFRPYEFFAIPALKEGAQWIAIFTLAVYFPSQFMAEGNLTVRPSEVTFALLLLLTALLSVPMAISPGEAWDNFVEFLKVILMFVVMVNVARTEWRFRGLLILVLAASVMLSFNAFNDYQSGRLELGGERVKGVVGGLFDNPNDLALHLVTMVPLAVGLAFGRRGVLKKIIYGLCAALFVAGVVVSFSRAGFLGLVVGVGVVAWKLGRKHRVVVTVLMAASLAAFVAATPGEYGLRITSIFGGDLTGSVDARRDLFWRSMLVALRYPLFGVGLGNFYYKGAHDQVSHNAYTQVAAEMGMAALVFYVMFMVTSLRRLRQIERESFAEKDRAAFYYLSVGLQASLAAYMVSSFFGSVAHLWYVYYLVGYSVCLRRLYTLKHGAGPAEGTPAGESPGRALSHAGAEPAVGTSS